MTEIRPVGGKRTGLRVGLFQAVRKVSCVLGPGGASEAHECMAPVILITSLTAFRVNEETSPLARL